MVTETLASACLLTVNGTGQEQNWFLLAVELALEDLEKRLKNGMDEDEL